jgi:ABC-type transporter MlaC component
MFKSLVFLVVVALFIAMCITARAAQTPSSASQGTVDKEFHKAQESLLKKDFKDAASEIRQAFAILTTEGSQGDGTVKAGSRRVCAGIE